MELLPVQRIAEVEEQQGVSWLVEGLWTRNGVGFLCGNPKSCKTWLALELALSVASKTAALGRYGVDEPGSVLLFVAEDPPEMVRLRLAGIAQQRGLPLADLPIHLVMQRSLRLESIEDQKRLQATVAEYQPKLLVLDPFVRLSAIDENSSLEVSTVLAFLRRLQTNLNVAILVIHHARKTAGSKGSTGGMSLRGSGDFWAWGDTNLYLTRKQDRLHLAIEHRSAATPDPVMLELCDDRPGGPYLRLCHEAQPQSEAQPLSERILDTMRAAHGPHRLEDLRAGLRVRMQTLVDTMRDLEGNQQVRRVEGGWDLVDPTQATNESGETAVGSAEEQPAKG